LVVYLLAIVMAQVSRQAWRKVILVLGLLLLLGSLATLKYGGMVRNTWQGLAAWFGWGASLPVWQLLLPVGISFTTFQAAGYLIDVYRGKVEAERNPGMLYLFFSFFPQLVAGPIERAGNLLPQLRSPRAANASDLSKGLQLVLWGMFKKVVIADRLAVYVDAVYNHPGDQRGWPIVLATFFFAAQLYADFSGYTDIALGVARILGYDLTENFRRPYLARSIVEFWRRWHMSLTSWFRDYVYIPLGGNRVPKWRWYTNVMVVFVVSGLWHGADWTFVLWGALHGAAYLVETWTRQVRDKVWDRFLPVSGAWRTGLSTLVTFVLVCLAWVFFRANSISDAFLLFGNATQFGASTDLYAPWASLGDSTGLTMALALGLIAFLAIIELIDEYRWKAPLTFWQWDWARGSAFLLVALAIMNLGVVRETPFVYLQF
jgi:D-alanyl-lipoteichoic acid acyltransferase DltB (MBOAT superfamily)